MRFFISTLGCKVNQHESEQMAESLAAHGMTPAAEDEPVDLYIVNSCTVTSSADQKTRKLVNRARREHPDAIICLTGCVPQAFPDKAADITGADIILGNSNRERLYDCVGRFLTEHVRIVCVEPHSKASGLDGPCIAGFGDSTRCCIKIEDGCNCFCSYCIIPYARGRVRSRPIEDIIAEARQLAAAGYREAVLVGINLTAYGSDCGLTLAAAVDAVAAVEGIDRIRLGSLEPDLLDDCLLKRLAAQPKLCPQFHMSLQSGCDATLKRMNRHYDTAWFAGVVTRIRELFDNPSVTTDVMVGFAGETGDEFAQSLDFVKQIGFSRVHCFVYSRRDGTVAASMPDQVRPEIGDARSAAMIEAAAEGAAAFMRSQIGRRVSVLIERQSEDGWLEGYTENYTRVRTSHSFVRNEIAELTIVSVDGDCCIAE